MIGQRTERLGGVADRLIEADHVHPVEDGAVGRPCVTRLSGGAVTLIGKEGEAKTAVVMKNTT